MANTREKLIELMMQAKIGWTKGEFADHLISHGVTLANGNNVGDKQGHWIMDIKTGFCYCSECLVNGSPQWKRCPVCEAKMETGVKYEKLL